jgi:hypothetical protein
MLATDLISNALHGVCESLHDAKKLNNCWEIRIEGVLELGRRAPAGHIGCELSACSISLIGA